MKTNITLDAGTTAFIATITDKLNRQARSYTMVGIGLIACCICNAILLKRVKALESWVSRVKMIGTKIEFGSQVTPPTPPDPATELERVRKYFKDKTGRYPWGSKHDVSDDTKDTES